MVMFKKVEINNKQIYYNDLTHFEVQIGKGKSSYKTVATFLGNPNGAVIHFNGLNVHSGYKKRLYLLGADNPIIARVITSA